MLLIVAHHYVVNSGLMDLLQEEPFNVSSTLMLLFGAWGKTGINCFVLITGYFMCRSQFTWEKLMKLYLQIVFYALIIYGVFAITGHEKFSVPQMLWRMWPVKSIASGFTSCFVLFYLFIPFLNIFLQALDKKRHTYLMLLLILGFSVLPTVPVIRMSFNYVGWFMILYLIGAYIRNYNFGSRISHCGWGWMTLLTVLVSSITVVGMCVAYKMKLISTFQPYFFVVDSNKLLSLMVAVSSFMYFKELKIPHSRLINAVGGATFGVLLIHANSDAMRTWLWRETVDCIGNYRVDAFWTIGYAFMTVLLIFIVCAGIDWFRGRFIEEKLILGVRRLLKPIKKRATILLSSCKN